MSTLRASTLMRTKLAGVCLQRGSRKAVEYTGFVGDDNDDDFADPTPPPKKTKGANKENKLKRKKDEEAVNVKPRDRARDNRQSLDDKLFDRDLEAALKLSVQSSGDEKTEVQIETPGVDKSLDAVLTPVEPRVSAETNVTKCLPSTADLDDEILTLSDDVVENPRKRRKAEIKAVKYDEDDEEDDIEEWNPAKAVKLDSDNDSEEEDDDDDEFNPDDSDSDYGSSKKKKANNKSNAKPSTKKVTPARPKAKASVNVTPVAKSKPASAKRPAPKPSVKSSPATPTPKPSVKSSPATPSQLTPSRMLTGGLKKAWVPPARTGSTGSPLGSLSLKSPTSGLRLGLSRNQKVKSLHPSVTS